MRKYILFYIAFLFYIKEEQATEIFRPDITELKEDLQWIIDREERNLVHLENSYKKFTSYYKTNVEDIDNDGELVRNQEIVEDMLVNIKLKLHTVSYINESALCYTEAYDDLDQMYEKYKEDAVECHHSASSTYERVTQDFLAFKKASKRLIRRVKKILKVCSFGREESTLCKRQYIPIKELAVLANHTYQYEASNVRIMDSILQSFRDCNALAIKPAAELAMRFVETIDEECDF